MSDQDTFAITRTYVHTIAYMSRGMRSDRLVVMSVFATVHPPVTAAAAPVDFAQLTMSPSDMRDCGGRT